MPSSTSDFDIADLDKVLISKDLNPHIPIPPSRKTISYKTYAVHIMAANPRRNFKYQELVDILEEAKVPTNDNTFESNMVTKLNISCEKATFFSAQKHFKGTYPPVMGYVHTTGNKQYQFCRTVERDKEYEEFMQLYFKRK